MANGFDLRYFDKAKYGEVDFLVQMGDRVLPLEMKSGADYAKHRALDNIMEVAAWGIDEALVFCRDNIRVEKAVDETTGRERTVSYLPWYCLEFLEPLGKGVSLPVDF